MYHTTGRNTASTISSNLCSAQGEMPIDQPSPSAWKYLSALLRRSCSFLTCRAEAQDLATRSERLLADIGLRRTHGTSGAIYLDHESE
jgi:hypothetical protein